MGLNADATIIPGKGTVLVAGPHAVPPTWATLNPDDPSTYVGWDCLGHTSRDNAVALSKSGGDSNVKGSWWVENLVDQRSGVVTSFTVNSLQMDYLTFSLAFPNGTVTADGGFVGSSDSGTVEKAVIVFMIAGAKRAGWYNPRVSLAAGDAPSIAVDAFFEIQLSGSVLASAETVGTTGIVPGREVKWYPPTPMTVPNPLVAAATPATATTGSTLTVNGLNLAGTTGVTVGGTAATSLVQVNANRVTVTMPSGSAGSAPIIVTTAVGASPSFAYTRGA